MQIQRVYKLTPDEINTISSIHTRELPESFLNNFGFRFLSIIYKQIPLSNNNIFLILREKNTVVGFLVAAIDSRDTTTDIFRKCFLPLSLRILDASLKSPALFLKTVSWFKKPSKKEKNPAELMFIAVDEKYQGKGFGTKLLETLFVEFKKNKVTHFRVGTKEDNILSNNFYKKTGFKFLEKRTIFGDRFNYYLSPRIS